MNHQVEQIENVPLVVPQVQKGFHTFLLKHLILRVLVSSHSLYHFLANPNRRRHYILPSWVLPKNEAKIHMEKMA